MSLYQIITVKTPTVIAHDAPRREITAPALPYEKQAKLDNAAVCAKDRIGGKFASDPATILARRTVWLDCLPEGQFNRIAARKCWDVAEAAADNRIDALERCGMLKRVKFKPIEWVRA